jgi:two-component system invasion response regulator UvrY
VQQPELKILLADDHEQVRHGLKQILLDGYPLARIGEAKDGGMLLAMVKNEQWDLVVSDISMPVMNGIEALVQIKKQVPTLPVLILSIHTEDQYETRAMKAGASGYLSKEKAQDELVNAVGSLLSGKKYSAA